MKKIIDIRDNYEYRIGHIDGAINIPRDLLELDTKKYINKKDKYILYCDRGIASKELSDKLNNDGYNTSSLIGGYVEYIKNN